MAKLKFLVVDDATFIRDLLKKNLRDNFLDCEIVDAPSAKKAQMLMKTHKVDAILCDWEMPEMTGEEFLRWVRSQPEGGELPFIMVTSRGERDYIVKAAQSGVSDYLGKPFTPEMLVAKVTKALKKVGKDPRARTTASSQGPAGASVDVLTGGAASVQKPKADKPLNDSASVLTAGAAAAPKPAAKPKAKPKAVARGQAQLNFPDFNCQCVIKNISLQMLNAAIKRGDTLPMILSPVVVSIVQNDGESVARLNAYVHSIQAAENHVNAGVLNLTIRFVDDDPDKLEHLSHYIATL